MLCEHLILCHFLLLVPSIFPSIRVFSNESVLYIRWLKYWSFSISPSSEYLGVISFRIDWLDFLAVKKNDTIFENMDGHRCPCRFIPGPWSDVILWAKEGLGKQGLGLTQG